MSKIEKIITGLSKNNKVAIIAHTAVFSAYIQSKTQHESTVKPNVMC